MTTVLDRIVSAKRRELQRSKKELDEAELEQRARAAPGARDFLGALKEGPPVRLIAEVKKIGRAHV